MRNMSFMLTTRQIIDETKDVTRRHAWWFLKAGELLQAVEKSQGLKKGEKINRLKIIQVNYAWQEPLKNITPQDVIREGFPEMTCKQFIDMFCESHKGVTPDTYVMRIEFSYVKDTERLI